MANRKRGPKPDISKLLQSFGLNVDGDAIERAVNARGFEGAQLVAVLLATAAYVEAGVADIEQAIDRAVETLEKQREQIALRMGDTSWQVRRRN